MGVTTKVIKERYKIFETNSSFIFQEFFLVLKTFSFWQEGYAQGYHYMTFTHFPAVS